MLDDPRDASVPPGARPGEDRDRGEESAPPDLLEAFRQIAAGGRASAESAWHALRAFRTLVAADVSLARNAAGRAGAFAGMVVVFGGSAWLLLMTMIVVGLSHEAGWPWWLSLLVCAAASLVLAGLAMWRAVYYFDLTRLKATRRQLARLGFGELADFTPSPGSPAPTRAAVRTPETPEGKPLRDEHGVELTPP